MIQLYTWKTVNGHKVSIMLEELGLPYTVHPINIGTGEQNAPDFLKISPNNKIPAIVDDGADGGPLSIFESGAILTYLAEKSGRFLPAHGPDRYKVLEWLYWQVGGLGPMIGQVGFFTLMAKEKSQFAIDRFTKEVDRLLGVLDRRLAEAPYLGGADYSIADMAAWPWANTTRSFLQETFAESMAQKPALNRWLDAVGERPAVQRGVVVPNV